jgi:hypothetical protein
LAGKSQALPSKRQRANPARYGPNRRLQPVGHGQQDLDQILSVDLCRPVSLLDLALHRCGNLANGVHDVVPDLVHGSSISH